MQIKEAEELQRLWADKPCDHPHFIKGTFDEVPTGDYYCDTCGHTTSEQNYEEIEKKRGRGMVER